MTGDILISIIIPVKNGDPWLEKTIPALLDQTLASRSEIIVIDSGSTDTTLSILAKYPVQVVRIPPNEFNHGETRNLGLQKAAGKFVVMTVQDAEPANEHWLQHLLDGFSDDKVAGVCGQQIVPHDTDKNPIAWFRPIGPPSVKKYSFSSAAEFDALDAYEKKGICRWDNVTAMYRRDVLLKIPFQHTSFAEDALWARDALKAGYTIVYNSAARVKHYHHESPDYAFRRSFTVNYHFYRFFGVRPSPVDNGLLMQLRIIKLLLSEKEIRWRDKWKWLWFNYQYRKVQNASVTAFTTALSHGQAELDLEHARICKTPPQAVKPEKQKENI